MKILPAIIFIFSISLLSCSTKEKLAGDNAAHVDPFIGTEGSGNTFSGPTVPFGMVQLGPYMRGDVIYGFSHTRNSGGAGGGNGVRGDILFMPFSGIPVAENIRSHFLKTNESASPGYYKVFLDDYKVTAELTATVRAGLHRYTFKDGEKKGLLLNILNGEITIKEDGVEGHNGSNIYFCAKFSKPLKQALIYSDGKIVNGKSAKGKDIKALFSFNVKNDEALLLKTALSTVSVKGARKNLAAELAGWDFEATKTKARQAWNDELNKIQVEGGSEKERTIFYTALYHSMVHPIVYMDVDGRYRSTDGKIYRANDFVNYTTFSLWDTFRALHPLFTIINRKRTVDFIKTFLERYEHTGRMLIMEFFGVEGEVPPMIGYHSLSVIADAYEKGIRDYDVKKVYKAMKELADDTLREGKPLYFDYGFIPADLKGQSVSRTLEYSYDDWCVTRLARDYSKDDELKYSIRGEFYKNLFCKDVNFMRGRKSNFQWVPDFDPMETINHYTEANAYQYTPFVPQDIAGLIELMGGDKKFEQWLDACFSTETDPSKINVRDVTGLIGQYAHGNEPSHHIAYLYNFAGVPWKTQRMARRIMSELYSDKRDGIDGNEDCGQMSAWYVLSAMGFYSVTPGMPYYVIGSPLFDKITIHLENGSTFKIIANNNSAENIYIQSATLNGKTYNKSYLMHSDIMDGATLTLEMGKEPNKNWASEKGSRPYSWKNKFKYAAQPTMDFPALQFLHKTKVTISAPDKGARIYYTTDGSEVTEKSALYKKEITINKSTVLNARSFVEGIHPSYPVTVHFKKLILLDALKVSGLKPGVRYIYREDNFPNAKSVKNYPALSKGIMRTFNVDAVKDERQFGYNFEGYIKVPETGVYEFSLEANDGAVLYINDRIIVDNDGGHRAQKLFGKVGLKKGWHPIRVDYFQQGLAKSLILTWRGPGFDDQEVPADVLFHK